MKSILDPTFRYTSSTNTDLRKTFARVRREMRKQDASTSAQESTSNVSPMFRRSARPARSVVSR
jgi:hypothetical protein